MDRLTVALPALMSDLSPTGGEDFAHAIMTTDTVPKSATAEAGPFKVGGSAKGVGMIAPNLATMLSFITTDAAVAAPDLQRLADEILKPRFNSLTVDACQSTNDTVLLFASGAAAVPPVGPGSPAWGELADGLEAVGDSLARQLIHDAEGVTHVLIVAVEGAERDEDARRVARAIADSPLVKTAAFGQDPNPGRILQAIGSAGVAVDPQLIDVWLGTTQVVTAGAIPTAYFDGDLHERAAKQMTEPEIGVRVSLGTGPGAGRVLGCDLSYEYVRINGEYTT
jgi:glutamate N-acetyltransferase/amino-acid N-acetyltransferase